MTGRPSNYLNWTDGNPSKVTQPPGPLALQGWIAGQPPPFQYANYQLWLLDQWIQYLDQITNTGEPDQVLRLMNGGNWSFDFETNTLAWSAAANIAIAGVPDANNTLPAGSCTISDGQVAYVTINPPIICQGTSLNGSNVITGVNFTGNLEDGMTWTGPGFASGTIITGVGTDTVTVNNNATSSNTNATYIGCNTTSLAVTVVDNDEWIPDFTTIMIARCSGALVYVGVNSGQMVLRDGEFKPLLGSGYFNTYTAPAGQNLTAGQVVYISPGSSDGGRTAGALYPLDASAANQAVRGTFAGVVISPYTTGQTATVVYSGFYAYSGLTQGLNYYADPATPGGIIPGPVNLPAGAKIVPVGFATGTNSLVVNNASNQAGTFSQPIFGGPDVFAGNGAQTSFPLSAQPLNAASLFVYMVGVGIIPNSAWSLVGQNLIMNTAPATGQKIMAQYVEAGQAYLQGFQGSCGFGNGTITTFTLPFVPVNLQSMTLYLDGGPVDPSVITGFNISGGVATVTLSFAPGVGRQVYATGLSPVGASIFEGEITGGQNLGSGGGIVGIFSGVTGTSMQFKSLKNSGSVTWIDNGDGTISAESSGGGGGGAVTNGDFASPVSVNPTAGITPLSPSTIETEMWWVTPTGSVSGVNPITANPQIAPASVVGKTMILFGVTNGSGGYLQIANGDGVLSTGDFRLPTGQCLVYVWDGTQWSFQSNAL